MQNPTYIFIPFVLSVIILCGWTPARSIIKNDSPGFAVVELFTSEGCSSCPAADAALFRIAESYKDKVYVLEFHVDYWNGLGWQDVFSSGAFSERQRQYASAPGGDGVYTPQAIINGAQHLVGSDEVKIRQLIGESLAKTDNGKILLVGKLNTDHSLTMSYSYDNNKNEELNIALIQLNALTKVRAGENKGLTLKHTNIVIDFKTVTTKQGSVQFNLPGSGKPSDYSVIAYGQNRKTRIISGASDYALNKLSLN